MFPCRSYRHSIVGALTAGTVLSLAWLMLGWFWLDIASVTGEETTPQKADAKPQSKTASAPLAAIGYRDLPEPVKQAVLEEVGFNRRYFKTSTPDGADAYKVTWRRYHRSFEAVIAADGTTLSTEETTPPAEIAKVTPPVKPPPMLAMEPEPTPETKIPKTTPKTTPQTSPKTVTPPAKTPNTPLAGVSVSFRNQVLPILNKNCLSCHDAKRKKGGIDLSNSLALMELVLPGKPDESTLINAMTGSNGVSQMPPGRRMSDAEIGTVRAWIAGGAKPN